MTTGTCDRCKRMDQLINWCQWFHRSGAKYTQICEDCWERVHRPKQLPGINGRAGAGNPGFDNVVRAMEEDR